LRLLIAHTGYDTGFFGGTIALDSFQRAFGIADKSEDEKDAIDANLVSLFQGGSFFGAALQLPVTQFFGRKWAIILSNIIFILSAFLQASFIIHSFCVTVLTCPPGVLKWLHTSDE